MATRGCMSRAATSEPQVLRVPCSLILRPGFADAAAEAAVEVARLDRRAMPGGEDQAGIDPDLRSRRCRRRATGPRTGRASCFTRRLERVSAQFPDVVATLAAGLGPREAIVEGEVVAYDAAAGELRPFGEVMFRRRKHGIDQAVLEVPVGLFCFELLYDPGG